jgi:hypothetical protein
MRETIVMLEMAARVRSRFIARDYSWAIAPGNFVAWLFTGQSGHGHEFGIALR